MLVKRFGQKFQLEHPNIPLKDLKVDKDRFLKQAFSKCYPLFGTSVIKSVLQAVDEDSAHQGTEAILGVLNKGMYVLYDENGILLDMKTEVREYVQGCTDCLDVQTIKDKAPVASGRLLQIPVDMEPEVLLFADKKHQGFARAYKRLRTWADFPHFKRKVFQITIYSSVIISSSDQTTHCGMS